MRLILWRFVSLSWIAVTGVVLLVAILFSISRAALPSVNDYRLDIQAHLNEVLGREISIGKIKARWHGTTPRIKLVDVNIFDASGSHTELSVKSIFFSLDIFNSLRTGSLRVKEIGIRGCDISIVRNPDHSIVIHGLELGVPTSWNTASIDAVAQSKINLIRCRVSWTDAINGKDYIFKGVNASIRAQDGHNRIAARLTPSRRLGRKLTVLMEFNGQLNQPSGWQGRLYVDAQDLHLEAFFPEAMLRDYGLERGRLKLENWSEWRQGKPVWMRGSFSLSEVSLSSFPATEEPIQLSAQDIDLIQARYDWQSSTQGWYLRVGGLKTVMQGRAWPESDFSLNYRFDGNSREQLRGAVGYVNSEQLTRLLPLLPGLTKMLSQGQKRFTPSGELNDVRFSVSLDEGRVERYRLSARVKDLSMPPRDGFPGVDGLDGWVDITERGGEAIIESRNVLIDYPEAFVSALSADYLSAVFTWFSEYGRLYIDSESLRIGNEDMEIVGGGRLIVGEGSPYIDVKLSYGHGNGANLERYLPKKIMPQKTHQWLVRSIGDVYIRSGTTVIRGKASEFPFVGGDGIFEASAVLEQGMLDYKPGWPKLDDIHAHLLFRGQSMEIGNARATVLDSKLSAVKVVIENLRQAELKMQAEIHGPLNDVWRYSSKTVLPKDGKQIIKDLLLDGESRMSLNINLPLSQVIEDREKVTGELYLKEAALELQEPNVKFENITGKLSFAPQGAQGQGIRADLNGRPVIISARPNPTIGTVIEVRGRLGSEDLVKYLKVDGLKEVIGKSLTGSSDWLAQVSIPHGQLANDNRKIEFRIWSDLHGMEINAPEPFMKETDKQEAFYFSAELGVDGSLPLQIRYGRHLSMALSMQRSGDDYVMMGGDVRFYRGEAALPGDGIKILGTLPQCSIDAWQAWLQPVLDVDRRQRESWGFERIPLDVDVDFHHLELFGYQFVDVSLSADKRTDSWHLKLDSQAVKGDMIVPQRVASNTPIRVNLDYLKLPYRSRKTPLAGTDPGRIPALQINSKAMHYGDFEFGDFYLYTVPRRKGMIIRDMHLNAKEFSVRLNGQWLSAAEQEHHTNFKLVLDSDDFGAMMNGLNLGTGFESGSAKVTAELQFPAAPYRWSYRGLVGNAHIMLQEGQFGNFEPGPWRVLGLMNINALSRRLALNFSDLLKKGFSYDNIEGNLNIEGSDVYTNDLLIKGPSADLAITGRMGLEARDYDQNVSITSKVSTGVTVAGALLGGVGVGAAIFVADRIINTMGGGIDNVTRLNYKVSGSWDDPKIELISPASTDDPYFGIMEDDVG